MTPPSSVLLAAVPGLARLPAGSDGSLPGVLRRPCTATQQDAWMVDRLDPGSPALNVSARWQLDGRVSVSELGAVFESLVARHPLLRTRLLVQDGVAVQQIEPLPVFHLSSIDLCALEPAEAEREALRLARLEAATSFDPQQLPLLRVTHLQVRAEHSLLLLTAHQAVCDAESLRLLVQQAGSHYHALHEAATPLESGVVEGGDALGAWPASPEPTRLRDERYWQRRLEDFRYFELASDHPRPPLRNTEADRCMQPLGQAGSEALNALAARGGCLQSLSLTALFSLLQRYSSETDIAVGVQFSGRDDPALANRIGPYAHSLVLRAELAGDPPGEELLATVAGQLAEARRHASTSLGRLTELLAQPRDLSRSPLFSISYAFEPGISPPITGRGLRWQEMAPGVGGLRHDFQIGLRQWTDGWWLSCDYQRGLFEASSIEPLLRHFGNLLQALAVEPSTRLAALPMLDAVERQRLVFDGNPPPTDYPRHSSVPELVSAQVRRSPMATAVVCDGESLSYRALDAAANRLAQWLRVCGVQPGDHVGVCLDRSLHLPAALLAVLKTGAAYVPLDPAYPANRLSQILDDAQPAAILCTRALQGSLPASGARIIAIDSDAAEIADQPATAPDWTVVPESTAYVIYTSGSTGRPKGVRISHRSMCNLLWAMRSQPGLDDRDRLLAVVTVSFDMSVLDLFLPLIVGARVVIARAEDCGDGEALIGLLRAQAITVLQATPATWQLLLAAGWQGDPGLRMFCGGEAISRRLADQLLSRGAELWNLYGPTEITVYASALRVVPGSGPVLIGPAIANTQLYVLDAQAQLLPLGVPGELYIGGDGVALGYLHRPELNAERFVEDRIRHTPGARLYRTGDRVRLRGDGCIEFLGRGDQQIKLRGFRIELGEIEAALRAQAEVADAIAVVLPDAVGEPAITAYVVPRAVPAPAAVELAGRLRLGLRQTLPIYMCPSLILVLDAWPRLPNGKVDRSALPTRAPPPGPGRPAQAPGNPVEQRLARIWREDLQLDSHGVDDNFFEIGGHSLLAARLLARIEREFGQRLQLATLFRNPSIAEQARVLIQGDIQSFDFQQVLRLQAQGSRPPLIAINNTGIFYGLSKRLGPEQPFTSLQLFDPALPQPDLPKTLEEIARGYVRLIRQVQPQGPYALLGWCVAGTLAFETACQLRLAGQTVSSLILFDTEAPGHLQRLSWPRRLLAEGSHRWQLIAADWVRARQARHRLLAFLANRGTVQRLQRWLRPSAPVPAATPAAPALLNPHQYDQWLLHYLEGCAAAYRPRRYPGPVLLFCSSQQPSGRFIDPEMGWGPFVTGGIDRRVIEGDHFNIFREPGVSQIASAIEASLDAAGLRRGGVGTPA